jgi:hypothetical protein
MTNPTNRYSSGSIEIFRASPVPAVNIIPAMTNPDAGMNKAT